MLYNDGEKKKQVMFYYEAIVWHHLNMFCFKISGSSFHSTGNPYGIKPTLLQQDYNRRAFFSHKWYFAKFFFSFKYDSILYVNI